MPSGDLRQVLDESEIQRSLTRISHEILERSKGPQSLVIVGIPRRGSLLATRLARRIEQIEGLAEGSIPSGALDVTMYRDDLRLRPVRALETTTLQAGQVDGATVILVDDVLYSGRTVRAALTALDDLGRARAVRLAVLIDRGHRDLPIRADHVGKNIPTSLDEQIHVRLRELDGVDEVLIGPTNRSDGSRFDGDPTVHPFNDAHSHNDGLDHAKR
jgi:pyrimidine operon attenuation protein / uracil phosphoribosyltransferase